MAWLISNRYTYRKDGVFYFQRRIPKDLLEHYSSPKIAFSLRTKSHPVALSRAAKAAERLDEHWYHLRATRGDLPGRHLLRQAPVQTKPATTMQSAIIAPEGTPRLSEAVTLYLLLKGRGRPVTFHRGAVRSCGYVIDVCGDKPLTDYTRAEANKFRDALLQRGLTGSSIVRVVGTVRSVMNFAASEAGLNLKNPFGGLNLDRKAGVEERMPIPTAALHVVQSECRRMDDDLRWLVALLSDSGLRLAEAAGLHIDDIHIHGADAPYVTVTERPWRRLKTEGSRRVVPLVGESLWAAQRVLEASGGSGFAFPRYNKTQTTNANSASASLNKWLKTYVPERCTLHSFRHSLRDRLRAVECPSDIVDQIGGWQTEGVGHGYGQGYPQEVLGRWMRQIV
jgi:integrase